MSLKVHYDPEVDALYLGTEGEEEEAWEIYPGIILELDKNGELIGLEMLNASQLLKPVLGPMQERAAM
ncbi:MAG: hypothetical protein PWQ41_352 [Bacillota bacterium]|nr:hypothetical protein [Bacillota bacterium]MDK2924578.1 hypothetical protein [Bacillota bacterium]